MGSLYYAHRFLVRNRNLASRLPLQHNTAIRAMDAAPSSLHETKLAERELASEENTHKAISFPPPNPPHPPAASLPLHPPLAAADAAPKGYAARFHDFSQHRKEVTHEQESRYHSNVLLVQFDSRQVSSSSPVSPHVSPDKANIGHIKQKHSSLFTPTPATTTWGSAFLNGQYSKLHGHRHVLYHLDACSSCDTAPLHPAWCKVAAMLQVR